MWTDLNANGVHDPGEPGLAGVTVTLFRSDDTIIAPASTSVGGAYNFTGLLAGEYYLVFDVPAGYLRSPQDATDDAADSDANGAGRTANLTLTPDEVV